MSRDNYLHLKKQFSSSCS